MDLRVEAGFKHGYAQLKRGNPARPEAAWWLVVNTFLLDPTEAAERWARKGDTGWLARLLELGDLYEKEAKLDQARNAYELLLQQKLPGEALAQQRLVRFTAGKGDGEAKP